MQKYCPRSRLDRRIATNQLQEPRLVQDRQSPASLDKLQPFAFRFGLSFAAAVAQHQIVQQRVNGRGNRSTNCCHHATQQIVPHFLRATIEATGEVKALAG